MSGLVVSFFFSSSVTHVFVGRGGARLLGCGTSRLCFYYRQLKKGCQFLEEIPSLEKLCQVIFLSAADRRVDGAVPVAAFAFFHFYLAAFFETGESEHSSHELFLLVVAAGHAQYVPAVLPAAQKEMAEVVVAVLQEAVVAQGALAPWEVYQILRCDFPALAQVTVRKWAEGLAEGEGDFCVIPFPDWCRLDVEGLGCGVLPFLTF